MSWRRNELIVEMWTWTGQKITPENSPDWILTAVSKGIIQEHGLQSQTPILTVDSTELVGVCRPRDVIYMLKDSRLETMTSKDFMSEFVPHYPLIAIVGNPIHKIEREKVLKEKVFPHNSTPLYISTTNISPENYLPEAVIQSIINICDSVWVIDPKKAIDSTMQVAIARATELQKQIQYYSVVYEPPPETAGG